MNKPILYGNRLIFEWELKQRAKRHAQWRKAGSHAIDNSEPKSRQFRHLTRNPNKELMDLAERERIHSENQHLIRQLQAIARRKRDSRYGGGAVDQSPHCSIIGHPKPPVRLMASRNFDERMFQAERIARENAALSKRLSDVKGHTYKEISEWKRTAKERKNWGNIVRRKKIKMPGDGSRPASAVPHRPDGARHHRRSGSPGSRPRSARERRIDAAYTTGTRSHVASGTTEGLEPRTLTFDSRSDTFGTTSTDHERDASEGVEGGHAAATGQGGSGGHEHEHADSTDGSDRDGEPDASAAPQETSLAPRDSPSTRAVASRMALPAERRRAYGLEVHYGTGNGRSQRGRPQSASAGRSGGSSSKSPRRRPRSASQRSRTSGGSGAGVALPARRVYEPRRRPRNVSSRPKSAKYRQRGGEGTRRSPRRSSGAEDAADYLAEYNPASTTATARSGQAAGAGSPRRPPLPSYDVLQTARNVHYMGVNTATVYVLLTCTWFDSKPPRMIVVGYDPMRQVSSALSLRDVDLAAVSELPAAKVSSLEPLKIPASGVVTVSPDDKRVEWARRVCDAVFVSAQPAEFTIRIPLVDERRRAAAQRRREERERARREAEAAEAEQFRAWAPETSIEVAQPKRTGSNRGARDWSPLQPQHNLIDAEFLSPVKLASHPDRPQTLSEAENDDDYYYLSDTGDAADLVEVSGNDDTSSTAETPASGEGDDAGERSGGSSEEDRSVETHDGTERANEQSVETYEGAEPADAAEAEATHEEAPAAAARPQRKRRKKKPTKPERLLRKGVSMDVGDVIGRPKFVVVDVTWTSNPDERLIARAVDPKLRAKTQSWQVALNDEQLLELVQHRRTWKPLEGAPPSRDESASGSMNEYAHHRREIAADILTLLKFVRLRTGGRKKNKTRGELRLVYRPPPGIKPVAASRRPTRPASQRADAGASVAQSDEAAAATADTGSAEGADESEDDDEPSAVSLRRASPEQKRGLEPKRSMQSSAMPPMPVFAGAALRGLASTKLDGDHVLHDGKLTISNSTGTRQFPHAFVLWSPKPTRRLRVRLDLGFKVAEAGRPTDAGACFSDDALLRALGVHRAGKLRKLPTLSAEEQEELLAVFANAITLSGTIDKPESDGAFPRARLGLLLTPHDNGDGGEVVFQAGMRLRVPYAAKEVDGGDAAADRSADRRGAVEDPVRGGSGAGDTRMRRDSTSGELCVVTATWSYTSSDARLGILAMRPGQSSSVAVSLSDSDLAPFAEHARATGAAAMSTVGIGAEGSGSELATFRHDIAWRVCTHLSVDWAPVPPVAFVDGVDSSAVHGRYGADVYSGTDGLRAGDFFFVTMYWDDNARLLTVVARDRVTGEELVQRFTMQELSVEGADVPTSERAAKELAVRVAPGISLTRPATSSDDKFQLTYRES